VRIVDSGDGGVALSPTPIRYPVNQTVTFLNSSSAIVQIATEDNSTFDSGPLAPGDSFTYTPSLIGSYYYRDKLHPWVRGVVVAIGR
jgi:plastocyanin